MNSTDTTESLLEKLSAQFPGALRLFSTDPVAGVSRQARNSTNFLSIFSLIILLIIPPNVSQAGLIKKSIKAGIAIGIARHLGKESLSKAIRSARTKLPNDPNVLLKHGFEEVSHPVAARQGHRLFENPGTGEKLRFDKGKPSANGYQSSDHYHRYNPEATSKADKYLDKDGNPCPSGCNESHLFPEE